MTDVFRRLLFWRRLEPRGIWLLGLGLALLVLALGGWSLNKDLQERRHSVESRSRLLLDGIEGFLAPWLADHQRAVDRLAGLLSVPAGTAQVQAAVDQASLALPAGSLLLLAQADQLWLGLPPGLSVSAPLRQQVQALQLGSEPGPAWQIGSAVGQAGQYWLPLLRRQRLADGQEYWLGALLPLARFERYVQPSAGKLAVGLLGRQGQLLWRQGPVPAGLGGWLSESQAATRLIDYSADGPYLLVQRELPGLPLRIAVLRWQQEYLAGWHQRLYLQVLAIVLAALLIVLLAASLAAAMGRLLRARQHYLSLFQSISDGVLVLEDGRVREANRRAAELLGRSRPEEIAGRAFWTLTALNQGAGEEGPAASRNLLARVLAGQSFSGSWKFRRLDDLHSFTCEIRMTRILLQRREHVLVCLRDISERLMAEEALDASRRQLIEAQRIAGMGVWAWEPGKGRLYCTEAFAEIIGLTPHLLATDPELFVTRVLPEDRPQLRLALQQASSGKRAEVQLRVRAAGGVVRSVLLCGEQRTCNDGSLQVLGAMLDISERERTAQQLIDSERRHRQLLEMLPEGLLIYERERVVFGNQAAADIFGVAQVQDLLGAGLFEQVAPESLPRALEAVRGLSEEPPQALGFEPLLLKRLNGELFEAECAAQVIEIDGQRLIQLLLRDLTAQRNLQHSLAEVSGRLRSLSGQIIAVQENERRHLARELHDDVGQLLTFIKLSSAAIQRQLTGDLEQRVAALGEIANDVLNKVRNLSRSLHPAQLEALGLESAIRWQVEHYLRDQDVQCRLDCAALEPRPSADTEIGLFRIFQEALSNALKHAAAQSLLVRLWRDPEGLCLSVRDDGRGFDRREVMNAGQCLGLLTMLERAGLLGAQLQLISSPGMGCEVLVRVKET